MSRAEVVGREFSWGIRPGFRDYIAALDDLQTDLDGVVWDDALEGWRFPIFSPSPSLLRFRAHAGALDIPLRGARLELRDDGPVIAHEGGVALARLLGEPAERGEQHLVYTDVALSTEGSMLFGGIYAPWARMDPVHLLG